MVGQAHRGEPVVGGVEFDPEVAASQLEGGETGGGGAGERVEDESVFGAAGGDAAQRDVDGEGREMRLAARCWKCPDTDGRDPIEVISAIIMSLDPGVNRDTIADAIHRTAVRPTSRRKLAWELEASPELLTGQGNTTLFAGVLRLINLLAEAGVAGIVRPPCSRCDRVVRLDRTLDGRWVCRKCVAQSRAEQCSRCGAHRQPATRDEHGQPLCCNCLIADPANLEVCSQCGNNRPVATRTDAGPLCQRCHSFPMLPCTICGRTAPGAISRLTGLPRCRACNQRTARCSHCNRTRGIHSGTLLEPVCGPCTGPAFDGWTPCPGCGSAERLSARGLCSRCLLRQHLTELLADADGTIRPELQLLHDTIADVERPTAARQWLSNNVVATVLSEVGSGQRPLTHQSLDDLPASQTLEHLRSILVTAGTLPERDEHMARLQRLVSDLIGAHADPEGQKLLNRYAIWHLMRRLRRRTAGKDITQEQLETVRQRVRGASGFLTWLAQHDLTLASCRQPDLECWLTSDDASLREQTGSFIRWARAHNVARDLSFPATRWAGPARALDHENRWGTTRKLLHDDTINTEDRLAGLLVLLYAQTPATISRLTIDNIQQTDNDVHIRFGQTPISLPGPVAKLAHAHIATRAGRSILQPESPWLFPGHRPGRPITASALRERLHKLGIRPGQVRSTALFQLATELPAAILARTLGIHIDVAVTWQRAAAGDWNTYAADISRRTT